MAKYIFIFFSLFILQACAKDSYYYQNNKKVSLEPIDKTKRAVDSDKSIDYYKNSHGTVLGVTDEILVKSSDYKALKRYAKEYDFKIVKEITDNLYLIKVLDKSKTVEIANTLYQKSSISYSHPNFIKNTIRR